MDFIIRDFKNYLILQKSISLLSITNYLVDLRNFLEWLILTIKTVRSDFDENNSSSVIKTIDTKRIEQYRNFLSINKTPMRTINRRLSTLRKFGKFAFAKGYLNYNPAQGVVNNKYPLLSEYKASLKEQGLNKTTIKNYLADARQFLSFYRIIATLLVILLPSQSIFNIYQYTSVS